MMMEAWWWCSVDGPTAPISSAVSMRGSNWVKYAQDDSINYAPHKKELNVVLWQTKGWRACQKSRKTMTRTQTNKRQQMRETYVLISGMGTAPEPRNATQDLLIEGGCNLLSPALEELCITNSIMNYEILPDCNPFRHCRKPPASHVTEIRNLFCCHKFWNNNYCHLWKQTESPMWSFMLHNKKLSHRKTYFILGSPINSALKGHAFALTK